MKSNIKTIVIAIIAIAILGGGFAGYWFNRPIAKATKAIEAGETEKVAEFYDKCNDEQKTSITDDMRLYCQGLSAGYINGEYEYEYVSSEFDLLKDNVMKDDETFNNIVTSVNMLHDSREAYKAATAAFEAKDYETALAEYEKVLSGDDNYEQVKENIEICKFNLLPDYTGVWATTINAGPGMAAMMGMAGDDRFKFDLTTYYEFHEDGTGVKYADEEVVREEFKNYMDTIIEIVIEQYEKQYGISREQLDKEFKAQYGCTVKEFYYKSGNIDATINSFQLKEKTFTYTVDGKTITTTDDEDETSCTFIREGDELLLTVEGNDEFFKIFEKFDIEYPLHLSKVE